MILVGICMDTLIDGYNLLYATGILGRNIGPGTLARARFGLLNFLAASLGEVARRATIVVFDARDAPRGVPRTADHRGITVRYAVGYDDADALVEELIRAHSAPRTLVVVSSDRHIQRMAKRRRAITVDSEVWYDELCHQRKTLPCPETSEDTKPDASCTDAELADWLQVFGDATIASETLRAADLPPIADAGCEEPSAARAEPLDPFPPGYADDVLEDD
jgi:uncharacterized protein